MIFDVFLLESGMLREVMLVLLLVFAVYGGYRRWDQVRRSFRYLSLSDRVREVTGLMLVWLPSLGVAWLYWSYSTPLMTFLAGGILLTFVLTAPKTVLR